MKRKIVSFFALISLQMPCMAQQLNYSISGIFADEGKKIYLANSRFQALLRRML